eukprot:m.80525 g.80525  ORF g.80525 m.80525 type:complete len:688 (-) comp8206_c0_seq4:221-2284(-)
MKTPARALNKVPLCLCVMCPLRSSAPRRADLQPALICCCLQLYASSFQLNSTVSGIDIPPDELNAFLEHCLELFAGQDPNKRGFLDLDQLVQIFQDRLEPPAVKQLLMRVDPHRSGELHYWNFLNLMFIERGWLEEPLPEGRPPKQRRRTFSLHPRRRKGVRKTRRGHILLRVSISPSSGGHTLLVSVKQCKDLLSRDISGYSDPYVKAYVLPDPTKASKRKTKVLRRTLNPVWDEAFTWTFPPETVLDELRLHITVWDHDRLSKNEFLGGLSFSFLEILDPLINTTGWFALLDEDQALKFNFESHPDDVGDNYQLRLTTFQRRLSRRLSSNDQIVKPAYTIDSFNFIKVLGRGNFGKVILASDKADEDSLYAVKLVKKAMMVEDSDLLATMTEREVLVKSRRESFLTVLEASFQTPSYLVFVMHPVMGGDLLFYLMNYGAVTEEAVRFYAAEICLGLFFLHEFNIIFRDLKPDNVLLDLNGHIRLADFGLSAIDVPMDKKTTTFCGTAEFMAPEIIQYKPYGREVDFWSLGVVLYQCATNNSLFVGNSEDEIFEAVTSQEIEFPETISQACRKFLGDFLVREPAERLGAGPTGRGDIQSHPFFADLDWLDAQSKRLPPPFVPTQRDPRDTKNFDGEFTSAPACVTPSDEISQKKQALFRGFSYQAPQAKKLSYFGFYDELAVEADD